MNVINAQKQNPSFRSVNPSPALFCTALLLALLTQVSPAHAKVSDYIGIGAGVHGTYFNGGASADQIAASGGLQLRVKFVEVISLRFDYDFARMKEASAEAATNPGELVVTPDIRTALGIHFYPNQYCSPYLTLGGGVNTGTGFSMISLLGGLGLETTIKKHWVIGAGAEVYYPTPDHIDNYVQREALRGNADMSIGDFLKPAAFRVNLELSYYL